MLGTTIYENSTLWGPILNHGQKSVLTFLHREDNSLKTLSDADRLQCGDITLKTQLYIELKYNTTNDQEIRLWGDKNVCKQHNVGTDFQIKLKTNLPCEDRNLKKHQSKNAAAVWEHQLEDAAIIWSETDLKIQHWWDNKVRKQHFVESNFQSRERGLNQTHGSKTKAPPWGRDL